MGVTIDGANHATVKDVAILGFGTCYKARKARMLKLQDCAGDCYTGMDIQAPDAPRIRDCTIGPLLTQNDGGSAR